MYDIFLEHCKYGRRGLAEKVKSIDSNLEKGFVLAYEHNHLHICKWIFTLKNDIFNYISFRIVLDHMIHNKNIKFCKWLLNINPQYDIIDIFENECIKDNIVGVKFLLRDNKNFNVKKSFYNLCENNQLNAVKLLLNIKPQLNDEINNIFSVICSYGYKEMIQYFIDKYDNLDISIKNDLAFRFVWIYGNINIAALLLDNKPDIDIYADNYDIFNYMFSCNESGYRSEYKLALGQWLICKNTKVDTRFRIKKDKELFLLVCEQGYIEYARWLYKNNPNMELDKGDIFRLLNNNDREPNIFLLRWVLSIINFDLDILYKNNYIMNSSTFSKFLIDIGYKPEKNDRYYYYYKIKKREKFEYTVILSMFVTRCQIIWKNYLYNPDGLWKDRLKDHFESFIN